MDVLAEIDTWGAAHAAAAVVGPDGPIAGRGAEDDVFAWASVTKLVTALAVLVADDRGLVALDEPLGPPGATVRHLLAHASGLGFEGLLPVGRPATTRIYSNSGYDLLGSLLAERSGRDVGACLAELVLEPLGMDGTSLVGRPSEGLRGPVRDLARLAGEILRPARLGPTLVRAATTVAFPGLRGILPGVGRFDPLDWGLGFEVRDGKAPHWTGTRNSASTVGHFGGAGTFVWIDPEASIALAVLTDRAFGPWALEAWPVLSDGVLDGAATG